ncbi:kinase-like protein [Rhizophagus irregularis]|uniref:Kinase-like protein n=1 Tax=Rhizophagus irregularis TaxID=588596 RepID=A0A2I1GKN5_9GLOM|nr:kinase-like protein [Rhizophagus irregularis]
MAGTIDNQALDILFAEFFQAPPYFIATSARTQEIRERAIDLNTLLNVYSQATYVNDGFEVEDFRKWWKSRHHMEFRGAKNNRPISFLIIYSLYNDWKEEMMTVLCDKCNEKNLNDNFCLNCVENGNKSACPKCYPNVEIPLQQYCIGHWLQKGEWTSNNKLLDECIRSTQIKHESDHIYGEVTVPPSIRRHRSHSGRSSSLRDGELKFREVRARHEFVSFPSNFLEWIPFEKFKEVQTIGKGVFGVVFSAIWSNGPNWRWDQESKQYFREGDKQVALKRLFNSDKDISALIQEVQTHIRFSGEKNIPRCYGITKDPSSGDYMLILEYATKGDLHEYLKRNDKNLTWKSRLETLLEIIEGLHKIHLEGSFHRKLHSGNILKNETTTFISDLGMCCPAEIPTADYNSSGVYGVLPYVAPELLRGDHYTKSADIYSFGLIMWELSTCEKPFSDRAHDIQLASQICNGLRPYNNEGDNSTPKCYINIMKRCWEADPYKRPFARELRDIIKRWYLGENNSLEFEEAEKIRQIKNTFEKPASHPDAIYQTRFLSFTDLPEPRI